MTAPTNLNKKPAGKRKFSGWLFTSIMIGTHWLLCTMLHGASMAISPNYLIELSSIGIPVYDRVEAAWRVNALFAHNNCLYIGTGDAVTNTGPTDIIYYDLDKEEFVNEFQVDEEAIHRFEIINGRLMIPGTDATEDWSFGNIYIQTDTGWIKYRTLPGALHVMNLIQYQDQLCAGTVTEAAIGEAMQSYHGAIYTSSDTAKNWELLYLTPSDGNNVFHLDALVEFENHLYAFVYAHCGLKEPIIPEEYRVYLGEPYEHHYQIINHDVFGMNDVLCYDGERWSYKDIIPGNEVARVIRPIVFQNNLVLPVIRGKYIDYLMSRESLPAQARTEIFIFDGEKSKKMKIAPEMVIDTRVINDSLYILFKQGFYYLAVANDLKKIEYYRLPSKIGTLRSFEYVNGVFYFGNVEGNIYKSISLTPINGIQQQSECVPKKCHGIMSGDAITESGWVLMYERIDTDSLAKITTEILGSNVLRASTGNLKQFKIFLPEYYLDLNKHVILLIDHDIIFDGRLKSGDEIMCRRNENGKWKAVIETHHNNQ